MPIKLVFNRLFIGKENTQFPYRILIHLPVVNYWRAWRECVPPCSHVAANCGSIAPLFMTV